jgi:hypothetical protein
LINNYLKAAEKAKLPPESDEQKRIELMKSENVVRIDIKKSVQ